MPSRCDSGSENPFGALEELAARQQAADKAKLAITAARARLLLGRDAKSVFFATLALRLKVEEDWTCETAWVDGKTLGYNPSFISGLTLDEVVGVLVHETLHVGLAHHVRRGDRDPTKFNEAADLAANSIMKGASFKLPKGALFPGEGKYKDFASDLSAEEYYVMLPPDPPPSESNDGQGDGGGNGEGQDENVSDSVRPGRDPGRTGEVRDPGQGSPAEKADAKADWEVAVAQAEQAAKQRGPLPAGLARMVDQVLRTPADWRAILREFVSQQARNDFSWSKPNRRFIAQGLYLPGLHSEELGEVVIMVDCSGSVGPNELAMFGSEIDGILSSYECEATILYHDVEVVGVEHWRSSDGPLKLEPVGGGGTSHRPAFDWVSGAHQGSGAACVVALTDLYTEFPRQAPDVPVLWAVVGNKGAEAPFGRIIHLD